MRQLDFFVIGAAKSGTTTLFELAKNHPEICMPKEKEVPFYDEPKLKNKGMSWYLNTYFKSAKNSQKIGTITPQYMLGKNAISPKDIATAIHSDSPDVKIVAILRDPIARAFSHYQMFQQRGHFNQDFAEATKKLLKDDQLATYRTRHITDETAYLLGSEYGRILSYYLDTFGKKQVLILTTEQLKANPKATLKTFLNFIGVDDSYQPANINAEFRKGGAKARTKLLTPGLLFKIPLLEKAWKNLTPYSLRKRVEYRINLWNIKPGSNQLDPESAIYKSLVQFYAADMRLLSEKTNLKCSWLNTYTKERT